MSLRRTSWLVALTSLAAFAACNGTGKTEDQDTTGGAGGSEAAGSGTAGSGTAGSGTAGSGTAGGGNAPGSGGAAGTGFATGGGSGSGGMAVCAGVSQTAKEKFLPADILWVVDTSGSMDFESKFVQQKLNAFAKGILDTGIDVQVVLISDPSNTCPLPGWCPAPVPFSGICIEPPLGKAPCPAPGTTQGKDSNPPLYTHVYKTVASTDGLNVIKNTFPQWKGALRPDATKTMIVVSDDDATDSPYGPMDAGSAQAGAKKWIADMKALDPALLGQLKVDGIYCFTKCPQAANVGTVWEEVVNQTGGVKGDLCKQDFQPIFNEIAKGVVAGTKLDCTWKIPPPPDGMTFDAQKVNVQFTPGAGAKEDILYAAGKDKCDPVKGGWYYDDPKNPKAIVACPASCTHIQGDTQGKIDIELGCETKVIDPK